MFKKEGKCWCGLLVEHRARQLLLSGEEIQLYMIHVADHQPPLSKAQVNWAMSVDLGE